MLKYLRATRDYKLVFIKDSMRNDLIGFSDANFGLEHRALCRSGIMVKLFGNLILWSSKLQTIPAHSTVETELYALDLTAREMIYIQNLLDDLKFKVPKFVIYCDNLTTIYLCYNNLINSKTKHIERSFFYIKHHLKIDKIRLLHVPSKLQLADILTKALPLEDHHKFVKMMRLFGPEVLDVY